MKFCVIRLGKSSVEEIIQINSMQGVYTENNSITIKCKQVPIEVENDTYCFLWLGSDNNKGTATIWRQGLRAIGKIKNKVSGPLYMDEAELELEIGVVFKRSLNKTDILKSAGIAYINISNTPVLGLNTSSNQTVQSIKPNEDRQDISILFAAIINFQVDLRQSIEEKYPEFSELIKGNVQLDIASESEDQIEQSDESNVQIKVPFDPNLIRLRRDPYTLGELIDRIEHDEINFLTGFQRKAGLWDLTQQSRLIESILLRLPLPAFYFDETEDNKWQVIDGLQRTTVIKNFIVKKSLELDKLEFLKEYNGKKYDDLPRDLIRRIKTTPLTVYVVEKGTPDEVKFNIFKRINTGGLILSPQEIRHALNQGIPAQFIAELANLDEFKNATCNIINADRMEDRDFVTRFVSFYIIPFFEYEPDLDSFMTKGMASLKFTDEKYRADIKKDFIKAMNTAIAIFGNDAFRKRESFADRRKPINKAVFETLSVGLSKLTLEEIKTLIINSRILKVKFIALNHDNKFLYSISSGTGQLESVLKRFSEINRIINETINKIEND